MQKPESVGRAYRWLQRFCWLRRAAHASQKEEHRSCFILSVIPPFSSLFGTRVVVSSRCSYLLWPGYVCWPNNWQNSSNLSDVYLYVRCLSSSCMCFVSWKKLFCEEVYLIFKIKIKSPQLVQVSELVPNFWACVLWVVFFFFFSFFTEAFLVS